MSFTSRERFGAAAMRRNAASACARRAGSSARHERNAVDRREATCGFFGVERQHGVGEEIVAGAVGAVELGRVRLRERADQRADAVRIGEREGRMPRQRAHAVERRGLGDRGLQRRAICR